MKEIKRYKLVATESSRNVIEASDGHWVRYADYYYVLNLLFNQCEENEEEASMKAHLLRNSVENNKRITKVSEENKQLQARIKELESTKHINEIKAQGIEEAIEKANDKAHLHPIGIYLTRLYMTELKCYVEQLRTKHDEIY